MECGYLPLLNVNYFASICRIRPGNSLRVCTVPTVQLKLTSGSLALQPKPWSELEDISIDYAVMERAPNLSVMPYSGAWSDLGDWQAIWREVRADAAGVVTSGPSTALDCKNTLLQATNEDQQLVAIGLEDIIAVAMPDAVLVCSQRPRPGRSRCRG